MASLNELVAEAKARFEKVVRDVLHDLPAGEHSDGELAYALAAAAPVEEPATEEAPAEEAPAPAEAPTQESE